MIVNQPCVVICSDAEVWTSSHLIVVAHDDPNALSNDRVQSLIQDFYEQSGMIKPSDVWFDDDAFADASEIWDEWTEGQRIYDFIEYMSSMGYNVFADPARVDFFPIEDLDLDDVEDLME